MFTDLYHQLLSHCGIYNTEKKDEVNRGPMACYDGLDWRFRKLKGV